MCCLCCDCEYSVQNDMTMTDLRVFIGLRRFDRFSLAQAVKGIRMSEFKIPSAAMKALLTPKDIKHFVYWLYCDIIIPLIKTHFYVTESAQHRNKIFYYRRPVWAAISRHSLKSILASHFTRVREVYFKLHIRNVKPNNYL